MMASWQGVLENYNNTCKNCMVTVEEFDLQMPMEAVEAAPVLARPPQGACTLDERAEMTKPNSKTELLSTIVASYAARPDVDSDDIVALVAKLRRELGIETQDAPAAPAAPAPEGGLAPAIPLSRAVTEDRVFCLCCGKGFKMLKRHLGAEHGMTEAEYRAAFGLPEEMPLVAPSYSRRKASYARKVGFGRYSRETARRDDETVG